jgi:predicted O-methyltransferase YrrM
MPLQADVMRALYGYDIWTNFEPYRAPVDAQGWNGDHPSLARLAATPGSSKLVIDVGVWKGQSTINMALALKNSGLDGCIIAVDTFLGSPEHWSGSLALFKRSHGMPDLYWRFMANVQAAGVTNYIVPMPQTSVTAAKILRQLGIASDLVHVDAAHEYEEVLRDATEYYSLLKPGGFLIGDDYAPSWHGVIRGANEFAARNILPLYIEPPKWIVQKPV